MDKKFEEYQNDEFENIQFGTLNEMLATDVAAYNLHNPSMSYSVPNLDFQNCPKFDCSQSQKNFNLDQF